MKMFASMLLGVMMSLVMSVPSATAADLPDGVKVGDQAPDFLLKNVDGRMVGPRSFLEAKGLIVVFTCNHCPYSVKYEDRIIDLHKKYAAKGYPVVAINPNDPKVSPEDSFEKMKVRAEEKSFPFPYVFDESQQTALKYGARRTPHVFVLNRVRTGWAVEYIGAIDDNPDDAAAAGDKFVEAAVDALLAGKSPAMNSTKAIGCTIKWKK
ncbi:MAG: thioredoxin family protein ['Candidatus Kapabacteria' thiocyanatum]|uniref:Thioredoxin family protein n=1 Tax=Candidatus Kapaibacterium thiocyanatum TaxID=1895771 RepID=A0A1M3KZK2_9BACT|nr:thioredoxin family protein ['Candidatus Kapabacteria' thiocyanatum]OJX57765.1 MAG: thioredoxin family protein ['Candidatus Kapabacteria' thiocyanatum]